MKSEEEIKKKIEAMKKRGYQSHEFGNYIEEEKCFSFADGLEWVLQDKPMRSEDIEQEFFRVFGIDEQCICPYLPAITAEKLLRLICICSSYVQHVEFSDDDDYTMLYEINAENIDDLKEEILQDCIGYAKVNQEFKYQIQQLFKRDNQ